MNKIGLIASLLASGFINGCNNPDYKPCPLIQTQQEFRENLNCKPLLISCEGMQFGLIPFSGKRTANLSANVAESLNLATITTNSSSDSYNKYLKCIEQAYERKKPIILMGFSQGADFARILAKKACEKDIPIDLLIYLDPTYTRYVDSVYKNIPDNVKKVKAYYSQGPSNAFRGNLLTKENFCNPDTPFEITEMPVSHLKLTSCENKDLAELIKEDIFEVLDK